MTCWNLSFGRSVYTACTLNPSHMGRSMVVELTVSHLRKSPRVMSGANVFIFKFQSNVFPTRGNPADPR